MTTPTSMTELEAVNVLLTTIGEAPINTLSGNQVVDVAVAQQVLNEVNREVQSQGWHFNIEYDVELSPDVDGNIYIPSNASRVDVKGTNVVVRSNRLYNLEKKTFTFPNKVKAEIIYYLNFVDLPDVAKRYITIRAARIFSDRMINSETISKMTSRDEQKALIDLRDYEGDTADYNMMDSYSVARVMSRGFNRRVL
jgi:hypothetical protein